MTTITLPFGGCIQTDGIIYTSGAYVHLLDRDGEIVFRAIHQEFQKKPVQTMENFLEALEEFVPNQSTKDKTYLFAIDGAVLKGSAKKLGVYEIQNPTTPLIEYTWKEWQANPEEVVGALLNCIETQNCREDAESWENEDEI